MAGVSIQLRRKKVAENREPFKISTPYDNRFGFWGVITELHPEDNTVHVRMDTGHIIKGVRVASSEWVTVNDEKDFLSGQRNLPPVDTFVFCMMPTGDVSSAFVLCSGFAMQESVHSYFKQEGEDAAETRERIDNSGWRYEEDNRTGTKKIQNSTEDPSIEIIVDQENEGSELVNIRIHGNEFEVSKDGIIIKSDKDIEINVEGNTTIKSEKDANIKVDGDATLEGQNITIKASVKTEIKGGQVVLGGTVAPTGSGALCGLPSCLFTGAPHVGDTSAGA